MYQDNLRIVPAYVSFNDMYIVHRNLLFLPTEINIADAWVKTPNPSVPLYLGLTKGYARILEPRCTRLVSSCHPPTYMQRDIALKLTRTSGMGNPFHGLGFLCK